MIRFLLIAMMVAPTLHVELKILDTPDGGTGPAPCALICSGVGKYDGTGLYKWGSFHLTPTKAYKNVDMSGCDFVAPPVVTATVKSKWWSLCPSISGGYTNGSWFQVHTVEDATPDEMRRKKCSIHWIATGYNC